MTAKIPSAASPTEPSSWWVMKFGGTSVATIEGWGVIAQAAMAAYRAGKRPLIVCSALAGVSNRLSAALDEIAKGVYQRRADDVSGIVAELRQQHLHLAKAAGIEPPGAAGLEEVFGDLERDLYGAALLAEASPRLRARVMAAGELASTVVGAAILAHLVGKDAIAVHPHDARSLLQTSGTEVSSSRRYLAADCPEGEDPTLEAKLEESGHGLHITQGFIANTPDGETALLGRGGSDVSASLFAERLAAERVEIWSDVPGFFTADPRVVPSARLLRHLDYAEAQELASTGAKVLHPRAIEIARRAALELHLRCTLRPGAEGTRISGRASGVGAGVVALAVKRDVTLITMETTGMWQQVGFLADVFAVFKRHGLSIDLVSTSETNVSVTLDPVANALDHRVVNAVVEALSVYCEPRLALSLGAISLVGRGLRAILPELAPAFQVLDNQAVHLVSQAANDLNLTVVVNADQADRIVRELHAGFFGAVTEGDVFGPTFGAVMDSRAQTAERALWWRERREELLRIAEEGTPHYVYHLDTIRAAATALRSVEPVGRVLYAVKANAHPDILRVIFQEGLGFECVSLAEVEHVLRHVPEVPPEFILFTPNFAPRGEYEAAVDLGAMVTIDNLYVLEAWPDAMAGTDIFIRVDPGQGRGHHAGVRTAGPGSKFGIPPDSLPLAAELASRAGARVIGLHAHLGSGITDPLAWAETAATLAGYIEPFPDVRVLDLGGGLGVPASSSGPAFDVAQAAEHLAAFKERHPHLDLWLEPGRFLVAEAGVLLARVTQRKTKGDALFVGIDAGMHTLLRPALYGAYHEVVNLTRLDTPAAITAEVAGPICESGDILGHGRRLPETAEGDVLLIATAGAYGRAMASTYNQRPLPRETVLTGAPAEE